MLHVLPVFLTDHTFHGLQLTQLVLKGVLVGPLRGLRSPPAGLSVQFRGPFHPIYCVFTHVPPSVTIMRAKHASKITMRTVTQAQNTRFVLILCLLLQFLLKTRFLTGKKRGLKGSKSTFYQGKRYNFSLLSAAIAAIMQPGIVFLCNIYCF